MMDQGSGMCSPTFSYLINYQIQSNIYNFLDESTENIDWLRTPVLGVWYTSNAITAVARTVAIAEVFFNGAGTLLSFPFADNCCENIKVGLGELFVHTPKNILRTICVPFDCFLGTIRILGGPKSFTMEMAEYMKTNLKHAKQGTLHSEEHEYDLTCVEGDVKPKFMAYQDRMYKRRREEKNK